VAESDLSLKAELQDLLRQGRALIDALGAAAGSSASEGVRRLDDAGTSAAALLDIHDGIVPLLKRLGQRGSGPRWWQRFTGEHMERDLLRRKLAEQLQQLAERGEAIHANLKRHAQALADHDQVMQDEIARHERHVRIGRLLLSPAHADDCRRAGLDEHDLQRLERRVSNLEAMVTATELTRRQHAMALQHAHVAADRYVEVRTLVMPLLQQATGMRRFTTRVSAQLAAKDPP
jgi:hypothetical protein